MNITRTPLLLADEPPPRTFNDAELAGCKEEGNCCHCKLCCFSMQVNDMPVSDGQGGIQMNDDKPVTATKRGDEFCWHLQPDGKCGIYTSPLRPPACDIWKGNNLGDHQRMQKGLFNALLRPQRPDVVLSVKGLIQSRAASVLTANPYFGSPVPESLLNSALELKLMLGRYLVEYRLFDEEVFEKVGIGRFIEAARTGQAPLMRSIIEIVIGLDLRYDQEPHRRFVERYFLPAERETIWTTAG